MKLEDQVCSLESAKKLKELGVKQESYFQHALCYGRWCVSHFREPELTDEWYSAFTVAELLSLIEPSANEWACGYNDSGSFYHFIKGNRGSGNMIEGCGQKESKFTAEENFTDSLGMWLIHLIENKLVTP